MGDELDKLELQVLAYLDGELSPADAAALEQTLASHPRYGELLADLRRQRDALVSLPEEPAPDALKSQLRQLAAGGVSAPRSGLTRRRLYGIAASLLLMAAGGVVVRQLLPPRGAEAPLYATRIAPTDSTVIAGARPPVAAAAPAPVLAAASPEPRPMAKGGGGAGRGAASGPVDGVALAQVQNRAMFVNASNNSQTIISVATDNPTVLQAEIGRLLRDNRISYTQEARDARSAAMNSAWEAQVQAVEANGPAAPAAGARGGRDETRLKEAAIPAPGGTIRQDDSAASARAKDRYEGKIAAAQAKALPAAEKPSSGAAAGGPSPAPLPNAGMPPGMSSTSTANPSQQAKFERAGQGSSSAVIRGSAADAPQQVLVARNLRSAEVAQIEQALNNRQLKQSVRYRVTDTSNSQMPATSNSAYPGAAQQNARGYVFAPPATQPAPLRPASAPATQSPPPAQVQALQFTEQQARPMPQQAAQQADQTMDLLIVVEPEPK